MLTDAPNDIFDRKLRLLAVELVHVSFLYFAFSHAFADGIQILQSIHAVSGKASAEQAALHSNMIQNCTTRR